MLFDSKHLLQNGQKSQNMASLNPICLIDDRRGVSKNLQCPTSILHGGKHQDCKCHKLRKIVSPRAQALFELYIMIFVEENNDSTATNRWISLSLAIKKTPRSQLIHHLFLNNLNHRTLLHLWRVRQNTNNICNNDCWGLSGIMKYSFLPSNPYSLGENKGHSS